MKNILILLSIVCLAACSSVKDETKSKIDTKSNFHINVKNVEFIANINTSFPENSISLNSKIVIAANDSMQMSVSAAFGLQVAKVYASKEEIVFFNIFENSVTTGTPSAENFLKLTKINLSFEELIHLLKSEVPSPIEEYKLLKNVDGKDYLALAKTKKEGIEYITLNKDNGTLRQYQFKDNAGTLITSVSFKDFKLYENELFASNIAINFPSLNGTITFEIEDIILNKPIEGPLRFKVPSDAKTTKLN